MGAMPLVTSEPRVRLSAACHHAESHDGEKHGEQ